MKINSSTVLWLTVGLIWCLFMGITAISLGFGSLFPSMNLIAGPFVCPNGKMELTTQDYQVSPTESGSILNWYCVDERAGTKTKLNPFIINFYAGLIYGLALFVAALILVYFYARWQASPKSAESLKWAGWIQAIVIIAIIVCVTLFNLMPLFRSIAAASAPISISDATATALAYTFHQMSSGTPVAFTSTEKPLTSWHDVPIMPQASAGQAVDSDRYSFGVPVDSGTIESFYRDTMKSQGWTLVDKQWLGMEYTKDKRTVLVTFAPKSDLQSWVVTLVLVQ